MSQKLPLLPFPRSLQYQEGAYTLTQDRLILLDSPIPQTQCFTVSRIQQTWREYFNLTWEVVTSPVIPAHLIGLTLRISSHKKIQPQGYELAS
jgi:hypothetical protein